MGSLRTQKSNHRRHRVKSLGLVILAMAFIGLLQSCAVGPDYQRPDSVMPETYTGIEATEASAVDLGWWQVFRDPALVALIDIAIEGNRDLRVAAARVDEARARLGVVRGDQWPTVGVAGGFQRGNGSELVTPGSGIIEGEHR